MNVWFSPKYGCVYGKDYRTIKIRRIYSVFCTQRWITSIYNVYTEIDDVVNLVVYLLSDKSSMISGETIKIDGALSAH